MLAYPLAAKACIRRAPSLARLDRVCQRNYCTPLMVDYHLSPPGSRFAVTITALWAWMEPRMSSLLRTSFVERTWITQARIRSPIGFRRRTTPRLCPEARHVRRHPEGLTTPAASLATAPQLA